MELFIAGFVIGALIESFFGIYIIARIINKIS